jgi:hypothetical protein
MPLDAPVTSAGTVGGTGPLMINSLRDATDVGCKPTVSRLADVAATFAGHL